MCKSICSIQQALAVCSKFNNSNFRKLIDNEYYDWVAFACISQNGSLFFCCQGSFHSSWNNDAYSAIQNFNGLTKCIINKRKKKKKGKEEANNRNQFQNICMSTNISVSLQVLIRQETHQHWNTNPKPILHFSPSISWLTHEKFHIHVQAAIFTIYSPKAPKSLYIININPKPSENPHVYISPVVLQETMCWFTPFEYQEFRTRMVYLKYII